MPSDANGIYTLPAGYLAVTGQTILASQHNPPLEDIADALSARLMKSGVAAMTGPLKITDGSAGAPSLALASNPTWGLYKTATGLAASVSGAIVADIGPSGLGIPDTNASHMLRLKPGSDLTADRVLTITTGDAARVLNLGGDLVYVPSTVFTPTVTLVGGAGNVVPVYSTNTGRYTRIGNQVFVDILLSGDGGAEGAGTGTINVALPIAAAAAAAADHFLVGTARNATAEWIIAGEVAGGGSLINLHYFESGGLNRIPLAGSDQSNTTRLIRLSFKYEV